MTKAEIKKIVLRKTMEGSSYREIYDELRVLIPNREYDLAKIIASKPSLAERNKYGVLNYLLCGLLLIFAITKFYLSIRFGLEEDPRVLRIMLLLPAATLIILAGVYAWRLESYYGVPFIVAWGFLQLVNPLFVDFDPWALLELALLVALMVLAFYIRPRIGGRFQRGGSATTLADGRVVTNQVVKWLN